MVDIMGLDIKMGESFFTLEERAGAAKQLGLGAGLSAKAIVDAIEKIQNGKIQEVYEKHGGDLSETVKELYGNSSIPDDIGTGIGKKMASIVSKMHNAANSAARRGTYILNEKTLEDVRYRTIDGIMVFNKDMKPGAFGNFVQDIMVLGGVGETLPKNSSLADIQGLAEIKETWQAEMLHVGSFTSGMIVDTSQQTETQVRALLKSQEQLESMAILELYIKMKNLLLIITDPVTSKRTGKVSYKAFTFSAIILYVDLLISEIKKWVEKGVGEYIKKQELLNKYYIVDEKGNLVFNPNMKMSDYKRELPNISTPYVSVEPEAGKKITTINGKIVVQEAFHLRLENLQLEKGNMGYMSTSARVGGASARTLDAFQAKIKNLQDIYKARYDILEYIKGEGRGRQARNFYNLLAQKNMPLFEMDKSKLYITQTK